LPDLWFEFLVHNRNDNDEFVDSLVYDSVGKPKGRRKAPRHGQGQVYSETAGRHRRHRILPQSGLQFYQDQSRCMEIR